MLGPQISEGLLYNRAHCLWVKLKRSVTSPEEQWQRLPQHSQQESGASALEAAGAVEE